MSTGRRTVNSLPRPAPSLRASTLPPCISTNRRTRVSPIPNPPWRFSREDSTWVNGVEDPRQHVGRDTNPSVKDADFHVASVSLDRSVGCAPQVGILRGVVEQIGEDLGEPYWIAVQEKRGRAVA